MRVNVHAETTYSENEILEGDFDFDPLFIVQRRPHKVRFGDGVLVRAQDDLRLLIVDMKSTKEKDETRECRVARDGLEPIICGHYKSRWGENL